MFLLIGVPGTGSDAQDDERSRLEGELKRYQGLINAYREGDDRSVTEILEWDPKRLAAVVAATQTSADVFGTWDLPRARAATMLHTDAAMRVLDSDDARLPIQLDFAARLLQKAGPDAAAFAVTWYTVVVRRLRDRVLFFVAEGVLETARRHLPRDPALLYESGVLQEQIGTFAAFINVIPKEIPAPGRFRGGMLGQERSEASHLAHVENSRALDRAAAFLAEAWKADELDELTRLHLGRVQILRGRDDEGAALLRPLASSSADPDTGYLASMFLAAMHQRRNRQAQAEEEYRAAIAKVPAAQSAHVALSEVLLKLGRGDESRAALLMLLQMPAGSRTEPWWWYLQEPIGAAEERLNRLRAVVRK